MDSDVTPAAVLLLVLVAGCGIFEPEPNVQVGDLRPIEPRAAWGATYGEVEACTGRASAFERVRWYVTDWIRATDEHLDRGGAWLGPWGRPHGIALHETRLARGGEALAATVRHEAIHEILQLGSHEGRVWCRCDGRDHLFPQCS